METVNVPCYKPLKAFKCADGSVSFTELRRDNVIGDIKLPCGQCLGCRLDRAREWSVRCLHESKLHEENCFLTLTYNDENVPERNSLDYRDFQLFMKRLRKHANKVRFFMCGEYGETTARPHYHALLFGYNFPDRKPWGRTPHGHTTYRSELLEKLWTKGNSIIGNVTRESAGYVARYCLKKITGDAAEDHYNGRTPEFAHMSLKPGIGADYFRKFHNDILPNDYVIIDGYKIPVPKYYETLYEGDLEDIKHTRETYARTKAHNNTPERLAVREEVTQAKVKQLKRSL